MPRTLEDAYGPATPIAHRTITALDGEYPPAGDASHWATNPRGRTRARVFVTINPRGATALLDEVQITVRPYVRQGTTVGAGSAVALAQPRLQDNSGIHMQVTTDNGVTYADDSADVIDNSAATQSDLDGLNTLVQQDWFVIGGPAPFSGVALDMDAANVNANASTITAQYWDGDEWQTLSSVTDGTASAGATLAQDGQISWAMPTDWAASTLNSIEAYWIRFTVSAQLSAAVDVEEVDLLLPIKAAVDVDTDGDDVTLMLESSDLGITGTLALAGTTTVSWR